MDCKICKAVATCLHGLTGRMVSVGIHGALGSTAPRRTVDGDPCRGTGNRGDGLPPLVVATR